MPKTVSKKTNVPKSDKKVSTQDKNKMIISNSSTKQEDSDKNKNENKTKEQATLTKKNKSKLEELKEKNLQYEKKLLTQEDKYKEEKKITLQKLNEYNSIIDDKNNEISNLTKNNKKKFEKLNEIKNEVDEKMRLIKIYKLMELELDNYQKDHEKKLRILDKEKIIANRNLQYEKKELETKKNLKQKYENVDPSDLKEKLEKLNEEIKDLQNITNKLKQIDKYHKYCKNRIKTEEMKLKILKNEKDFEIKKQITLENQMINKDDDMNYLEDEEIDIKKNKRYMKNSYNKNLLSTTNHSVNISQTYFDKEKVKKTMEQMKRYENLRLSLENDLNKVNKQIYLKSKDSKKFQPTESLFLKDEKNILKKYFPTEALKNFQKRFDVIQTEKKEIERYIEDNKEMKQIIKENKEKIDLSDMKKQEIKKKTIQYNSMIIKQKKAINDFNEEIKKMQNELHYNNQILKVKNEENAKLKKHFDEIVKIIHSKKLKLKEGKQKPDFINDDDEEDENNENPNEYENGNEEGENEEGEESEQNEHNNNNDDEYYQENEENEED